jgi:hypothetical protein
MRINASVVYAQYAGTILIKRRLINGMDEPATPNLSKETHNMIKPDIIKNRSTPAFNDSSTCGKVKKMRLIGASAKVTAALPDAWRRTIAEAAANRMIWIIGSFIFCISENLLSSAYVNSLPAVASAIFYRINDINNMF